MHDDIDAGLVEAGRLVQQLSFELEAILHKVGTNDSMSALLERAAVCWDWAELAFTRPSPEHVRAFRDVCVLLRPCMDQTLYPLATEFSQVSRSWPSVENLCAQYMCLARRVRMAMAAGRRSRYRVHPDTDRHFPIPGDVVTAAGSWGGSRRIRGEAFVGHWSHLQLR